MYDIISLVQYLPRSVSACCILLFHSEGVRMNYHTVQALQAACTGA